ncbi:MAG: hypothetical protein JWO98_5326 [Frankiales bacterium]|nr:hypothetical protein [Frankiales bacterium]
MARANVDTWLVEDRGSDLIQRIGFASVVETNFRSVPMTTYIKSEPRIADMDVDVIPKGGTYGEDTSGVDEVLLTTFKYGKALRLAEEDSEDTTVVNVLDAKKLSWGRSFATKYDNASIGVVAAQNGITVPHTSIYRTLSQADSTTGYAAGANLLSGAALTYDELSALVGLVEVSGYHDDSTSLFFAHPAFKAAIRGIKDTQGHPIFIPNPVASGIAGTLFGYPVKFTNGAKTTATASSNPTGAGGAAGVAGNPLFGFGNTELLLAGKRSGPESVVIPGRDGLSALTDEDILKVRARRAFTVAMPAAVALFELTHA